MIRRISVVVPHRVIFSFFFFNDPAPPEFYPLSLHDALPISGSMTRADDRGSAGDVGYFEPPSCLLPIPPRLGRRPRPHWPVRPEVGRGRAPRRSPGRV